MEKELLNRVIVEWAVDVHWPDRCEVDIALREQLLGVQLALVSRQQVRWVLLPARRLAPHSLCVTWSYSEGI